jgi:hypothetical protein
MYLADTCCALQFLSPEEADHIIHISEPGMTRSGVVETHGGSSISNIRTSFGVFLVGVVSLISLSLSVVLGMCTGDGTGGSTMSHKAFI